MSAAAATYRLRPPVTDDDWHTYHAIRRKVLFENRGRFGTYNDDHPDERAPGNHPLVLERNAEIIGTIRIDIATRAAILRMVAIRDDAQRGGHGKVMLSLAEAFARDKGRHLVTLSSHPNAVGFYERFGYHHADARDAAADATLVPMSKTLR
jgi:GNAT superfamily N-acetyltransferase